MLTCECARVRVIPGRASSKGADVTTTVGTPPKSLTQLMMPSAEQITRARRRLHYKAAFIAVLGMSSYVALVFAPVGFLIRVLFGLSLVVASVATATGIMHDGNHGAFSRSPRVNRIAGWSSERHQLRSTVDVRCRVPVLRGFVHWLMGGHAYQIEHHLAPRLPHTSHPLTRPGARSGCVRRAVSPTARTPSHSDASGLPRPMASPDGPTTRPSTHWTTRRSHGRLRAMNPTETVVVTALSGFSQDNGSAWGRQRGRSR
jgi:hypothetical protein